MSGSYTDAIKENWIKDAGLDICKGELLEAARALTTAADRVGSLIAFLTTGESQQQAQPQQQPQPQAQAQQQPQQQKDTEAPVTSITLEEVRAVLAEKSRLGSTDKIRELLLKHGASKLSDISPSEYPSLLKSAEVL